MAWAIADNAWVGGVTNCSASCPQTAIVEQWNGQSWQPVTLPDSNLSGGGAVPVIGTSSAGNTWIFDSDINNIGYGVPATDTGVTQTTMPAASGGLTFTGAAVFGSRDAWAFGVTGDFNNAIFSAYSAHYDSQTWTELPTPPVLPESVSALARDEIWILGHTSFTAAGFAMAHWTGSGWVTVPIPDASGLKLPAAHSSTPSASSRTVLLTSGSPQASTPHARRVASAAASCCTGTATADIPWMCPQRSASSTPLWHPTGRAASGSRVSR